MKIAIIAEILSTHSGARAAITLAKHLAKKNQVSLICYQIKADYQLKALLEKLGVDVYLIESKNSFLAKYLAALKILPVLKENGVISFFGTLPTFLAAKLSGLPVITTYCGTQLNAFLERFSPNQKIAFKDNFLNWLINQIVILRQEIYFRLSTKSVAISRYTAKEAKKLYGKKIPFIYLCPDYFKDHRLTKPASTLPIILSVSRLTPYKGFHHLINCVKKINQKVRLIIVGSAPQSKYLAFLKKIKSKNVKIIIDVSDQKLASLYRKCRFYASTDRYLFFGLPVLEAALSGKPSLLMDRAAASEMVVHKKTGLVAKNLDQFSTYLNKLLNNPLYCTFLGKNAKKWCQDNFSCQKTTFRYQKLFNLYQKKPSGLTYSFDPDLVGRGKVKIGLLKLFWIKLFGALRMILLYQNWPTAILNHLYFPLGKEVTYHLRNGPQLITRTTTVDRYILDYVLMGEYQHPGFSINKADTVIDIGAHIGTFTIWAASQSQTGRIYSFEPCKENFAVLKRNIKLNHFQRIKAYHQAVFKQKKKVRLFLSSPISGSLSLFNKTSRFETVWTTTLADIFKKNKINYCHFLKLDCEGAEYPILETLPQKIYSRIGKIVFEYHQPPKEYFHLTKLLDHLKQRGFKIVHHHETIYHKVGVIFAKKNFFYE